MKISWGIKIIIVFGIFAAGIITMASISFLNDTELVSENYYEHEIKYQEQINAMKNSVSLANDIDVAVKSDNTILIISGNSLLRDMNGEIHFYRASNEKSDFKIAYKPGEEGIQTVSSAAMDNGVWKVKFTLLDDNENKYFIEKNIFIN